MTGTVPPDLAKAVEAADKIDHDLEYSITIWERGWWKTQIAAIPEVTKSVDAALGLLRRHFPKWTYRITDNGVSGPVVTLFEPPRNPEGSITDPGSWSRQFDAKAPDGLVALAITKAVFVALTRDQT